MSLCLLQQTSPYAPAFNSYETLTALCIQLPSCAIKLQNIIENISDDSGTESDEYHPSNESIKDCADKIQQVHNSTSLKLQCAHSFNTLQPPEVEENPEALAEHDNLDLDLDRFGCSLMSLELEA